MPVVSLRRTEIAHHALAGLREPVGDRPAPCVVDADDRGAVLGHAGDEALLHRGIMLHRAVAVEMIFAEIDQNADRRIERGRKIDLIGRAFDDVNAARRCGGASDRIAVPILPPSCASMPAEAARWAISAVVVDLPLVPVMATNGAPGAMTPSLAAEQLDVADHFDAGFLRQRRRPNAAPDASAARPAPAPARRFCSSRRRANRRWEFRPRSLSPRSPHCRRRR